MYDTSQVFRGVHPMEGNEADIFAAFIAFYEGEESLAHEPSAQLLCI